MTNKNTTLTRQAVADGGDVRPMEDEVVVRLSNRNRRPRPSADVTNSPSAKQHCVGDYSCCGHVP